MPGHGSDPAPDKGEHPNRKVTRPEVDKGYPSSWPTPGKKSWEHPPMPTPGRKSWER